MIAGATSAPPNNKAHEIARKGDNMTRLIKPVPARAISRRRFLSSTAAAGAAAAGISTGLMPSMARAQQKRGGSFRIAKGHGQTSDTLNPAIWENGFMTALAHGVHGYIASIRADGSVKPELAESWEASSGADSWSFKIRYECDLP